MRTSTSELADKLLTAALVVAFVALLLVGCSPAITLKHIQDLEGGIQAERAASMPRPGFEPDVAALQSATNGFFEAAKKAFTR